MRFRGKKLASVLAMASLMAGPLVAEDMLPAWNSREEVDVPAKPKPAPKPVPKPVAAKKAEPTPAPAVAKKETPAAPVQRESIIYGENTSDANPIKIATNSPELKSTPAPAPVVETAPEVQEEEEGFSLIMGSRNGPVDEDFESDSEQVVERKVRVIHVKAHQKSLSSKTKPLVNRKVTTHVIREEIPAETEADILPQPVTASAPTPAVSAPVETVASQPVAPTRTYTIRSGDTLWGISRQFKVKVDAIKTANGLTDNIIKPGQVLTIPTGGAAPASRPAMATTPSPAVASAPAQVAVSTPAAPARSEAAEPSESSSALSADAAVRKAQLKLRDAAISLARHDIDYNENWRPPGERKAWTMDCSNTSRYLMRAAAGLEIPRTASSQYWVLDNENLIWRAPKDDEGRPSKDWLANNLQVGDLLFWEHTYKPVRTPPVTHVTVFLGKNKKGEWIMAGSQSAQRGELTDDIGGPDLYVFNPHSPSGGYSTGFLGMEKVRGRFVGIGRPFGLLGKKDIKISKR